MLVLVQLIAGVAAVVLVARAAWEYTPFGSGKDVGKNLIAGCFSVGLAVLLIYEIMSGTPGIIHALGRVAIAFMNYVAVIFETTTAGALPTLMPTIVPTAAP